MESTVSPTQANQMIVTLDDSAAVAEVRKALLMIRGIASVRMARISDDRIVTPALRRKMRKARQESSNGETIVCSTPEEMQRYFDSL